MEDDYSSQKDLAKTFILNLAVQGHSVPLPQMLMMCEG